MMTIKPRFLLLPPFLFVTFVTAATDRSDSKLSVGLQLWSLREEFKKDPLHALDLTRQLGFTEVETAGIPAGMTAEEYRAALETRGLKPVGAHVQYGAMQEDIAAVVREVQTLGSRYAFCPWIPHDSGFDQELVEKAAKNFNAWGAAFRKAGIKFGYHTHGYEFVPGSRPGETLFDDLVRLTNPEDVSFQLDVLWVYRADADPLALLKKYPNRWASIHIKDIRKGVEREPGASGTPAADKVVVGTGAIDWKEFLGQARKQGIMHYVLEDESDNPLEQIPASMRYLNSLKF